MAGMMLTSSRSVKESLFLRQTREAEGGLQTSVALVVAPGSGLLSHPLQRSRRSSSFVERIDRELWPLFTCAALKRANLSTEVCAHLAQREFYGVVRRLGVNQVDSGLIWRAEQRRAASRRFGFSAFKRGLCVVASRVFADEAPAEALCLALEHLAAAPRRFPTDISATRRACASVLGAFAPCLGKIFAFFAETPSQYELEVLRRHPARPDCDRMQQSLSFKGWGAFAAIFSFGHLGAEVLSAIFIDSTAVDCADELGGLTLEEFFDAVLRAALVCSTLAESAIAAGQPAHSTTPRRFLAGLRTMRDGLERTVPRATNAGHERTHAHSRGVTIGASRRFSTNTHLLIEGTKEFQLLTDEFWAALRKKVPPTTTSPFLRAPLSNSVTNLSTRSNNPSLLTASTHATSHELHNLMMELSVTEPTH